MSLPVQEHLREINELICKNQFSLIKATPGSGKTTLIPKELLKSFDKKIIILEPRKLAAKFAANYVSKLLNENVGETCGYIFKNDRKISNKTRLIYITEGTFIKILNDENFLNEVDCIIIDEFHERHKEGDALLSYLNLLTFEYKKNIKTVILSATIDETELLGFLKCKLAVYDLKGTTYNLNIKYIENKPSEINLSIENKIINTLNNIIKNNVKGDILIFLDGIRTINLVKTAIENVFDNFEIFILHGDLSKEEQERVTSKVNKTKIILSTNIAESSITIPGIRIVIDSGFYREIEYSHITNLPYLKTKKISKSSAIQRSGRANREDEGFAFRLYTIHDYNLRNEYNIPEIERTDISDILLFLIKKNVNVKDKNFWFANIKVQKIEDTLTFLHSINAIKIHNEKFVISEIGDFLLRLPLHVRLGRVLFEALFTNHLMNVIKYIANEIYNDSKLYNDLKSICLNYIKEKNIMEKAKLNNSDLGSIFFKGFYDKTCILENNELMLYTGQKLKFDSNLNLTEKYFLILDTDSNGKVIKGHSISIDNFYELEVLEEKNEIYLEKNTFYRKYELKFGKIVLEENKIKLTEPNEIEKNLISEVLACKFLDNYLQHIHENELKKLNFLEQLVSKKIDKILIKKIVSQDFYKYLSLNENLYYDIYNEILNELTDGNAYKYQDHLKLQNGKSIKIIYDQRPVVEAYIQDFYGVSNLHNLEFNLSIRLLGPNKIPVQTTANLLSFWDNHYQEIRKQFLRDYPRHYWPENPKTAKPILLARNVK